MQHEIALLDQPVLRRRIEKGEVAGVEIERDASALAGCEGDLGEGLELLGRTRQADSASPT